MKKHLKKRTPIQNVPERIKDYDGDGEFELIVLGSIKTVGASTPLQIYDRIVFVFDIFSERIKCIKIELERDADSSNSPFEYFR